MTAASDRKPPRGVQKKAYSDFGVNLRSENALKLYTGTAVRIS